MKNKIRNRYYRSMVEWMRPQDYFKKSECIVEDEELREYQEKNKDKKLRIINYDTD